MICPCCAPRSVTFPTALFYICTTILLQISATKVSHTSTGNFGFGLFKSVGNDFFFIYYLPLELLN